MCEGELNFQTSPISVSGSVAQFDRIESSFIVPKMPQSNFKNYPKTKNNISTCLRCFILSVSTQRSICIDGIFVKLDSERKFIKTTSTNYKT